MNRACKVCPHHKYYPKQKTYGIGMHWCVKYNDHISDCHCEQREMMSRKGLVMPQRDVRRAYYNKRNNGTTTTD